MRGERGVAGRDRRHNKDESNLKSSLKKGSKKAKKHRVVFDESANEFFEADYIIVVRDECYSDGEECGACERFAPPAEFVDAGALSPPEGYKDMGLFNRDGTLREQAWWEPGGVALLVGERSGTVFTPQHLQLLRRLQRERMLRATLCADCDAHAALHQPLDIEYGYEEEEMSDAESGREAAAAVAAAAAAVATAAATVRPAPVGRRGAGKHIAAGEERPRTNSSQQTTPTDECVSEVGQDKESKQESSTQVNLSPETIAPPPPVTSEDSDTAEAEGRQSAESSPRARRGGILKGGRLWKSFGDGDNNSGDQADDQRSTTTTASDEDGSQTPRSVRFYEDRPPEAQPNAKRDACDGETDPGNDSETSNRNNVASQSKEASLYTQIPHTRLDTPLILTNHNPKATSAVRQLFNSSRPPPPAIEAHLVTSESLRAWDTDRRTPRSDDVAVRRAAERNALRCSLLRSEARKKAQPKTDTTSLAERIRLLTCDVDDEPEVQEARASPAGSSADKPSSAEKAYSASSSSSSSTMSVPPRTSVNAPAPDLAGDLHHDHKHRPEPRRQFLSTLAPLTACVGSAANHEGFYYVPPGDRVSASSATDLDLHSHGQDAPAPDVVAGTPGAMERDDGLAAFARAAAPRTERLRQRYQESQPASSDDDENDDYGFHRRPTVRGIKPQVGPNDILHQMQSQMQPASSQNQATSQAQAPPHSSCPRSANYSWAYYSESNLAPSSRPVHRTTSNVLNWSTPEYVTARCSSASVPVSHIESCSAHAHIQSAQSPYAHAYHRGQESIYQNCSLYANVRCSDSNQDLYNSHTSSEQTSPVRVDTRRQYRRPESPPPIRNYHHLMYIPYNNGHQQYHYSDMSTYVPQWSAAEYKRNVQMYYQQQSSSSSGPSTPQPAGKLRPEHPTPAARLSYSQTLPLQVKVERQGGIIASSNSVGGGSTVAVGAAGAGVLAHASCPVAAARYRTVSSSQAQSGSGQHMICYSEKVQAPMYQPAPGSPSHAARGAPEGAPAAVGAAAMGPSAAGATSPIAPSAHNSVYYAMNV